MAQRPSGWYDDPDSPDLLRYWDGVVWTEHVANKRPTPPTGPSDAIGPYGASRPAVSEPAAGSSTQQWAEYQARQAFGDRRDDLASGGEGFGRRGRGDGAVLSGWWRRVGAFYLDTLLVALVCLPITWSRYQSVSAQLDQVIDQISRAAAAGGSPPQLPQQLLADASFIGVVQTVVYILLEVFLLTRKGVTPGRYVTRIRVRRVDADEPLDLATASRRTIVKNVSNLLSGVPFLSMFASIFQIVDYLWPLGDKRRQSIHDKVATSEVVRMPRGPRGTRGDQGPLR